MARRSAAVARRAAAKRHATKGLTPRQSEVLQFLRSKKVSDTAIKRLMGGRARRLRGQPRLDKIKAKVDFLEGIELDPARYGVRRIPVALYEGLLGVKLKDLKKSPLSNILWPLEDAHAEKQLDRLVSGWRESTLLKPTGPRGPTVTRRRSATLLQRAKAALARGIPPTPYLLHEYSAEAIAQGRLRPRHSLDSMTLAHRVETAAFSAETRSSLAQRYAIVDALAARPNLSVNESWLARNLQQTARLSPAAFETAVEELRDLGVISKKNGCLRIHSLLRTGTHGPTEHKAKIDRWFEAKLATRARKRALGTEAPVSRGKQPARGIFATKANAARVEEANRRFVTAWIKTNFGNAPAGLKREAKSVVSRHFRLTPANFKVVVTPKLRQLLEGAAQEKGASETAVAGK